MINVLEYLEDSAKKYPDKTAFLGTNSCVTFKEMLDKAQSIALSLISAGAHKEPVVIAMTRSPEMIIAFFGVIAAGCYYVPIDEQMPAHRTELIMDRLKPALLLQTAPRRYRHKPAQTYSTTATQVPLQK